MSWGDQRSTLISRAGVMLAALALVVRLLIPAGFMLSSQPAAAGTLPGLVICTGHGELTLDLDASGKPVAPGQGKHDDGKSNGADHPCTFAASAATQAAPQVFGVAEPLRLASVQLPPLLTTQRPGLGLAAPPPPTTGPPSLI